MKNRLIFRKGIFCIALLFGSILFVGCHNHRQDSVKKAIDSNRQQMSEMSVQYTALDAKFTDKTADGGKTEIMAAKVALKRATDTSVKNFAQRMIADHSKMGDSLSDIAKALHIIVPDSLSNDAKKMIEKLRSASTKDFDKTYMDAMVDDHQKDVMFFAINSKTEINNSLKNFIASYLPVIRSHLDMAKMIVKKLK